MLDKFSKNVVGLIFQYLEGNELIRCELVNKKVSQGARQDYIWRYLSENKLEFNKKFYNDTWKQCFWRNYKAQGHMTPDRFNHQMCPIRHFKSIVKYIDSYINFIFACDVNGNVAVFLVNENDLENDEETLQVQTILTEGVEYLQFITSKQELLIVTTSGSIQQYAIEQQGPDNFEMKCMNTVQLNMKTTNLYVCQLDQIGQEYFISNYPLDGEEFMADQTINIYNAYTYTIAFAQTLQLDEEPNNNYLRNVVAWVNQNQRMYNNTLTMLKNDKNNQQIAAYNGQKLLFSTFNNKLVSVDTQMSKVELFMKKQNYQVLDIFNNQTNLAMGVYNYKGILITYHIFKFNLYDFATMAHTHSFDIQPGSLGLLNFNLLNDELFLIRKNGVNVQFFKIPIDIKTKKVVEKDIKKVDSGETHAINDMDLTKHLFATATTEGNIKLRRIADESFKPYFLNCGSKTIKTYIPHPDKPGVSIVKATPNKIVAVLGNLIRVYSFDFVKK